MREYVIVAQKYQKDDVFMFWGYKTGLNQERSYSGYTTNFEKCEKYTLEEITQNSYRHKIYGIDNFTTETEEHFAIKVDDLEKLGAMKRTVYSY